MKIGIFDSGVGGITVLKEALKLIPDNEYIYYADKDNVPYGTKEKNHIKEIILGIGEFFNSLEVDILVIACNTATSIAIKELREKYSFPIIGMEPAVKPAIEVNEKKILVLATQVTIEEDKYTNLIKALNCNDIVNSIAMPELVKFAEEFIFEEKIIYNYLEKMFSEINWDDYSTVVLGCTHFIYYKKMINDFLKKKIDIIDGNIGTVKNLERVLKSINKENLLFNKNKVIYYVSGKPADEKMMQKYIEILGK